MNLRTIISFGIEAFIFAAALTGLAYLIGYLLIYRKVMRKTRRIPIHKLIFVGLLVADILMTLAVTLLMRGDGMGSVNMHLFASYREAWNSVSASKTIMLLLNILMFVPLGFLLPITWKSFRRVWLTFAVGAGFTLLIETTQLITSRGVFDIDDILNNILGAMLGYCVAMTAITLREKTAHKPIRVAAYAVLPCLALIAAVIPFAAYNAQELGNLENAYSYRCDTSKIKFELAAPLDNSITEADVYKTDGFTVSECDEWAKAYLASLGAETDKIEINYYDGESWYMCRGEKAFSIRLNLRDKSWELTDFSGKGQSDATDFDRVTVAASLAEYELSLPPEADFENNDFAYVFTVRFLQSSDKILDGSVTCYMNSDGSVRRFINGIVELAPYKAFPILTQTEAYERLKGGKFQALYDFLNSDTVTICSVSLGYCVDSKGYYQPVYRFEAETGEGAAMVVIPAIK